MFKIYLIFFQDNPCSYCTCRKDVWNRPVSAYYLCCECLNQCPCGLDEILRYHPGGNYKIVGCTPCGCGCPLNRIYDYMSGDFKCASCREYCVSQGPFTCYNTENNNCNDCSFPASARVFLENGQSVPMSELKIGDRVQSGNFCFN